MRVEANKKLVTLHISAYKDIISEAIKARSINVIIDTFRFNLRSVAKVSKLSSLFMLILFLRYCSSIMLNLLMICVITIY